MLHSQVREDVMRLVTSAKRWISDFASKQESANATARNVAEILLSYLTMQEGRMTSHGSRTGLYCPAFAKPGPRCNPSRNHLLVIADRGLDRWIA